MDNEIINETEEPAFDVAFMRNALIRTKRVAPRNEEERKLWVKYHGLPYRGYGDLLGYTDCYFLH